ncbi:response regulator transcription factor [Jatrophihabitans sp. YIM 134969]
MSATAARVLVVEDEQALLDATTEALAAAGFQVSGRPDGRGFLEHVAAFRPDVVVLDVMLPGEDGMGLARRLKATADVPVLFVTARDAVEDRLTGFEIGADDYVVKPFVLAELVARVTAVLRRAGRLSSPTIQVDDLVLDEEAATVTRGGRPVELTATERRLLTYLVRNRGRTLSKTQILTQVWGYDSYDPNLVEAFISTLRRKLDAGGGGRLIHTVRGIGYRLQASDRVAS